LVRCIVHLFIMNFPLCAMHFGSIVRRFRSLTLKSVWRLSTSKYQVTSIDRKVVQTSSCKVLTCAKRREGKKNKTNKDGRRMDSAFARSVWVAAGRKRVITLVNLSDVFEGRKEIGRLGDGTFIDSPRGRSVSLVNSYYNWRDRSNARKSRTIRRCGSCDSLKSRRHLYKSREKRWTPAGFTDEVLPRELRKKLDGTGRKVETLPCNARTFGFKRLVVTRSVEKVVRADRLKVLYIFWR